MWMTMTISMTIKHLRKEVEEFFDEMDRDFDGRLSFAEFMGEETPLEKLFKSMDKDGDGTVTKEVTSTNYWRWVLEFQTMSEFLCGFPPKSKSFVREFMPP